MALYPLDSEQFSRVAPLFREQARHHLFCAGVLAGAYAGKVIVDHPESPRSALVIKDSMWCFPGGDSGNTAFNGELAAALAAKQFVGDGAWGLLFIVPDGGWHSVLDTLLPDRQPIATPRLLYLANKMHFNPPSPLPEGFALRFMDDSLPSQVDGELPGEARNVLDLRAKSPNPDQAAFGYVAIHGRKCVSVAMVDCIVGAHGEIGLETNPAYRRQGVGMAVSGAAIAYGLSHGLSDVHWDVVSYNTGSVKMAERHGLQLARQYDQNLLIYGQASYLANLAWDHLDRGRFQDTLDVCAQLLALADGQKYGHFLAGVAWAGLGDRDKAFHHLGQTIDHGWDSLDELENSPPLKWLQGTPEWDAIAARLQAEAPGNPAPQAA